ncbi:MAG: ComEC/Rec2 family competence protein [bacterium]|nr:ComEC/Rec2 family competence protein [bacterium]
MSAERKKAGILAVLFLANLFAFAAVYDLNQSKFLEVNFFDVGQGDSIFIETPYRDQILIDGGPDATILEKLRKEMPFWDRTIDLIILTHPEKDHLTGLLDVLKRYQVENILWTGVVRDTAEYKEWEKLIKEEGARIIIAKSGENFSFSDKLSLLVLSPSEILEGKVFKDSNDTSIVAKLTFGDNSFLFTGDISKSVEKKLLLGSTEQQLKAEVLKVAHHGSKTSTSKEFAETVSPEIAVIQAGKDNSYGHPRQETLDTLAEYGIKILRTDLDGDIKIISNGSNINIY